MAGCDENDEKREWSREVALRGTLGGAGRKSGQVTVEALGCVTQWKHKAAATSRLNVEPTRPLCRCLLLHREGEGQQCSERTLPYFDSQKAYDGLEQQQSPQQAAVRVEMGACVCVRTP